ncbi:hypothetical protein RU86_GL000456 [Lactococcus piscium]|uniref:Uncharacterized protein n=1 Tax=Pseudolactococcus piscium TaxID=1364 RepID=A0A2A5RXI8_9LACT|nr:hypothetical protein [Lactococcus piscium]PCS05951.1 hypothetical protein RU86_GL000456 [Lactococcus piscium]
MSIFITYLYEGSAPLKLEVLSSVFSLFVGIIVTFVLSKVIQKQVEDNFIIDVFVLLLVIYMMVEAFSSSISISLIWKSDFIPKSTMIMTLATLVFLLGTWYMYFQAYYFVKKKDVLYDQMIDGKTLLDATPFGKIVAIYSSFTVLMGLMIIFVGPTTDKIKLTITPFPIINIIISLIIPTILVWYLSLTLPRMYYSAKIEKIIALHNEEIKVKKNGKRN